MNEQHLSENNPIVEKSFLFAVKIVRFCQSMHEKKHFVLSNQLLRSGTSIGASCKEAQNAESRADFIHKFKIAAKEAEETEYWLALFSTVEPDTVIQELLADIVEIKRILTSIITSSKNKH